MPGTPLQRIIIKGHTAASEHGIYRRGIDLAFTRVVTTRDYLISLGHKEEQFQIVVAGQFELLKRTQQSLTVSPRGVNVVVEVLLSAETYRR
ncbi:hypothetical protein FACS1894170_10970 [Planctomycetales bacterium]|nr:hypothetical protein FACS1894170_10970 [Planctomycetales bacterium]